MKILLDENVPLQARPVLERTLLRHEVRHVEEFRGWKGKLDEFLLPDAAGKGFEVFVTKDQNQLSDPEQTKLIRLSKMHHVRFEQGNKGLPDYARAVGSLVAAMYDVIAELSDADGQRLVKIVGLESRKRHQSIDPKIDPPAYWRKGGARRPSRPRPTARTP